MTKLEPIRREDFERLLEREIHGYAEDHVRNRNWHPEGTDEELRSHVRKWVSNHRSSDEEGTEIGK